MELYNWGHATLHTAAHRTLVELRRLISCVLLLERRVKERTLAKMTGKQNSYRVDLFLFLLEIRRIDMHNDRGCQLDDSEH